MPQLESCTVVEPLILENLPQNGSRLTLYSARYNYMTGQFVGYTSIGKGPVKQLSITLEPHVACRACTQWIHGWITDDQIVTLYKYAAQVTKDNIIVEIGSWKGKSTVALGWGSKSGHHASVWSVDPHQGTFQYWLCHHKGVVGSSFPQCKANIEAAGVADVVYPLVEPSMVALELLRKPIGLLFIDGNHDYASQDGYHWWDRIVPGGHILLHDVQYESVRTAIDIILATDLFTRLTDVDNMAVLERKINS